MAQASKFSSSLRNLEISRPPKLKPTKHKATEVADSWDDDALSDNDNDNDNDNDDADASSTSTETASTLSRSASLSKPLSEGPLAPPPTPASPTSAFTYDFPYGNLPSNISNRATPEGSVGSVSGSSTPGRRPEKTTAVAGRLIAGALGVKAPRRTEEEREYDRVTRNKEKERREREREEGKKRKQEEERARRAVWED